MQSSQRQWAFRTADAQFETTRVKLDNHAYVLQTYGLMVHCGNAVLARAPAGAEVPVNQVHAETGIETLLNQVRQWL